MSTQNDYPSSIKVELGQNSPVQEYDPASIVTDIGQEHLPASTEYDAIEIAISGVTRLEALPVEYENVLTALSPDLANITSQIVDLHTDPHRDIGQVLSFAAEFFPGLLSPENLKVQEEVKAKAQALGVTNPEVDQVRNKATDEINEQIIACTTDQLVWQEAKARARTSGIDSEDVKVVLGKASTKAVEHVMTSLLPEAAIRPEAIKEMTQAAVNKNSAYAWLTSVRPEDVRRAVVAAIHIRTAAKQEHKVIADKDIYDFMANLPSQTSDAVVKEGLRKSFAILQALMGSSGGNLPFADR